MAIDKPFAYHAPSPSGLERITRLREAFSAVKAEIERNCPPSRQCSVALTELETAAMWAIIFGMSVMPLIMTQIITLTVVALRPRA